MPGKTTTPMGMQSRIWSLRLKGAALACLVQSGLKATCDTLRLEAVIAAMRSALFQTVTLLELTEGPKTSEGPHNIPVHPREGNGTTFVAIV